MLQSESVDTVGPTPGHTRPEKESILSNIHSQATDEAKIQHERQPAFKDYIVRDRIPPRRHPGGLALIFRSANFLIRHAMGHFCLRRSGICLHRRWSGEH